MISYLSQFRSMLSVAARLIADDPTHLLVQSSRRLPVSLRHQIARIEPSEKLPQTLRALIYTLADRRREATRVLISAPSSNLANGLRITHGMPLPEGATRTQLARQLWDHGDLSGALAASVPGSVLHEHLDSQTHILEERSRLLPPRVDLISEPSGDARPMIPGSIRVIHLLTNSVPHTQSGYSMRSHNILRALRAAGIEVEAVTRIGYPLVIGRITRNGVDRVDGIDYRRVLPARMPRRLEARYVLQAKRLAQRAREFGADIIHTTTPFDNALIAEAAARALKIPWVYEARGEMENTWLANRPAWAREAAASSERYIAMRAKEAEMAGRADAVVTLSNLQRKSLIRRGVPAEKISVIGNAVDTAHLERECTKAEARHHLGLTGEAWVGTVSAIVDYEGLDTLIHAIAILRNRGRGVNAAIVGDGVALQDLRDLVRSLGLESRVLFPGRVDPSTARVWYQALDIMTIPRRDTQVTRMVTPIKGLQAMGVGIPQIVSDLPALREVGTQAGQGAAIPAGDPKALADEILRLIDNPHIYKEMASCAREAAHLHTWKHRAQQYREVYRNMESSFAQGSTD